MKKKRNQKLEKLGLFSTETRNSIARGQQGYCYLCTNKIDDIHHKVHNTETNRKLFPTFINSIFNGVGLCRQCHQDRFSECDITLDMAVEYEQALQVLETMVLADVIKSYSKTETNYERNK